MFTFIRIGYKGKQDDPAVNGDTCLSENRIDEPDAGGSAWGKDRVDLCGVCLKAKHTYCIRLSYT